jgi:epothilone synthetase B
LLHEAFLARAATDPSRLAVISERISLTYAELDKRSEAVAALLLKAGARPGRLVAVVMEKGWEQVVAVLAILRSGAAYLPIDPTLPDQRRDYMLSHGRVDVALTQSWVDECSPGRRN